VKVDEAFGAEHGVVVVCPREDCGRLKVPVLVRAKAIGQFEPQQRPPVQRNGDRSGPRPACCEVVIPTDMLHRDVGDRETMPVEPDASPGASVDHRAGFVVHPSESFEVLVTSDRDVRSLRRGDVVPYALGLGHRNVTAKTLAHGMPEIGEATNADLSPDRKRGNLGHLSAVTWSSEVLECNPPRQSLAVVVD
jgi:hypothetical protein